MVWALLDSDGRLKAVADTQAGLVAATGETIVDAGDTPLADGYTYDAASQTWSPRADFFAPGQALVAELRELVLARCDELNLFVFGGSSQAQNRNYIDHLANSVSAALVPVNQTDATKIATIRRELELHAGEWVLRATGFSQGLTPTEFEITVTPETGAWTKSTDASIAVEPRAFGNRGEFLLGYLK